MYQTLSYQIKDQAAVITFTRPEALNPLDQISGPEICQALEAAGHDPAVRAIILTGQGRAFSAGGNVRAMRDYLADHPGQGASPLFRLIVTCLNRSILAIRQAPKPVIAAVNGVAAGGGLGWVLASDLVLAAPEARFDTAYIRIAASPDGGNTFFLPRLVGPWRAAELFFLGQSFSAEEGLKFGLVSRLVDKDKLLDEALALAADLARRSAPALARTKALLTASFETSLAGQLELERQGLLASSDEPDFEAAIKAFFDRKK